MPVHVSEASRVRTRVAAFTGSHTVSSARFRLRQYVPHLRRHGVLVTEYIARFGSWPPAKQIWRPFWLPATLINRVPGIVRSYQSDVTLLQREMVSSLVTLEGFTRRPRLLDVDDAVWLGRGGEKNFRRLVRLCDGVICGNEFIRENVRRWTDKILVLPTAVDTNRFRPIDRKVKRRSRPTIGWSGLGSNLKSLYNIERPLAVILGRHPEAVLRVVSSERPTFKYLDGSRVEFIRWSPQNEVETIQGMSVGLMPTEDSLWSRGKCSYKMLLYMACGVPPVVSPVGMNNDVLALGTVGLAARSHAEWVDGIDWLLANPTQAQEIGKKGRRIVEDHYSVQVLGARLASYINGFHCG